MSSSHGYIWTVYHWKSDEPTIALGQAGEELKARARVEDALDCAADAAFGLVIGPPGVQNVCRRARGGGYLWRPLAASAAPLHQTPLQARLDQFKAFRPEIVITPPRGPAWWRAAWLTDPEKGGAQEVERAELEDLLDYLERKFPVYAKVAPAV